MLTPCSPNSGADPAEHAGQIAVAKQGDVILELDVEALAPGLDQMRAVAPPDQRPRDPHRGLAGGHLDAHEIGVVASR